MNRKLNISNAQNVRDRYEQMLKYFSQKHLCSGNDALVQRMPFQYHDILQNDNQSQGLNTEFKTQLVLHNNLMNLDIWKIERSETVMTTLTQVNTM